MDQPRRRVTSDRDAYLASDYIVDHDDPRIRTVAARLREDDPVATARRSFEFVRDTIEHSADHRRSPTTLRASDVLTAGTGFCYAKSHLLVALLRANRIASGFCYQRLTVDGPNPPFCLHGYVAIELPGFGDYAVDPRGNKPGVDARFEPPIESLAFPIVNPGEVDFPHVFDRPLEVVVQCLRANPSWDAVLANLPDATDLDLAMHRSLRT